MRLFYAMGGGMGHLYRTWVITQQFAYLDFKVVTSNTVATKFFAEEQIIFIDPNNYSIAWTDFITKTLPFLDLEEFFVDAFPLGIFGELSSLQHVNFPVHYVARRIKWKEYEKVTCGSLAFHTTFILEPLESMHEQFVRKTSTKIQTLHLQYPLPRVVSTYNYPIPQDLKIWLVVHAFNREEVETLLQYAQDVAVLEGEHPYYLVLSDQLVTVPNGTCMHYPSVMDWFPVAERIFSAGGFNTVQQVLPFIQKTSFMPFPRRYDDQAWRVKFVQDQLNV